MFQSIGFMGGASDDAGVLGCAGIVMGMGSGQLGQFLDHIQCV
ncbi:hypothetical protein [Xenorhabdus sp. KK7.4]|nr:hypothetical protein [Xenorhabdus sp. KK7.4]